AGAPGRLAAAVDGAGFEAFLVARIMRLIEQLSVCRSQNHGE
ncbi:MAG: hypothetical protein K0Q89_1072, partial [Thermomicrobiales bacterium]|nr:hypothetical protein [Thermomicrobiales bacterium]